MKALLHLKDGKNETVELLMDISEKMGDLEEFVNAAYTSTYYKGTVCVCVCAMQNGLQEMATFLSGVDACFGQARLLFT